MSVQTGGQSSKDIIKKRTKIEYDAEPEETFRIYSILSYFIVLVLLGIPIWWYTTRVYRASLPLSQIQDLQLKFSKPKDFGIPLNLEYDILVSFVHPDPENLKINADPFAIEEHLQEFVQDISPVADIVIKSQWLYLTELGAVPKKVADHFALYEHQLPHVITPLESRLWSHVSPRFSINLVVYFPHCTSPLFIYDSNNEKSKTNAFTSPRWGGLYILNSDEASCQNKEFRPQTTLMSATFQGILKELFGIDHASSNGTLDDLKLRKTKEFVESSKRTLKSLAQLLSEINSIVISDKVADKINLALESVQKAESYLSTGNREEALRHAKLAFKNSEEAFADPSLLALLYFPDDQKYAIYIPLFLPVMIPVVMSLIQVKKRHSKLSKQKEE